MYINMHDIPQHSVPTFTNLKKVMSSNQVERIFTLLYQNIFIGKFKIGISCFVVEKAAYVFEAKGYLIIARIELCVCLLFVEKYNLQNTLVVIL